MQDVGITVVVILLAVILLFVFPLLATAENKNDVDMAFVQSAATDFVDACANKGAISFKEIDALKQKIATTGNTFNINMEVSRKSDNVGKKTTWQTGTNFGEGAFFTLHGSQITDQIDKTGAFKLLQGDTVTVKLENQNKTMASNLKSAILGVSSSSRAELAASASALVTGVR